MRVSIVLCLALGVVACTDDGGDDDDDLAGGDGDGDADGDADGLALCEEEDAGFVSAYGRGDRADEAEHVMVVTDVQPDELRLEEDRSCDPDDEIVVFFGFPVAPPEAWWPSPGDEVLAAVREVGDATYGSMRSPDGTLLFEGGHASADLAEPRRFVAVELPEATECRSRDVSCAVVTPLHAAVRTDDGDVELAPGEQRVVTVNGEPYLAVVVSAASTRVVQPSCVDDFEGGDQVFAYLVRTAEAALVTVAPGPPPVDDCPALMPSENGACTTRADEQCAFDRGQGCIDEYVCEGCFWRLRTQFEPQGVDCGLDPGGCLADDGACYEETVCTNCACPDPIGARWRCVQPGDECPPCE